GVFACNRMLDAHQFPQAREAMESLLRDSSALLGIHRSLLVNDLVFCALREGEVEKANSMLTKAQKKFMRSMKSYPSILRTEYAYALVAEKDEAKAGQIREKFRKLSHSYPYPSELASETELFDLATGDPDL
ncbi:MAG: hypothetical protein HUJ67_06825, partial [Ruminiclostridium sp.]|nr:hypothetical protein [Ruminiclostridium sp.]